MNPIDDDPLLQPIGSAKDLWADEQADEYVRRIREGWDEGNRRAAAKGASPKVQILPNLRLLRTTKRIADRHRAFPPPFDSTAPPR